MVTLIKSTEVPEQLLFNELSQLIDKSKEFVAIQANSTLTILFWKIGKRINEVVLQNKRADYGRSIVATVSRQLSKKYGRGFEEKNLRRMLKFAEQFPDEQIVVPLARQLSWSHFVEILPIKTTEAKLFYAQEALTQKLGVRELRKQIAVKAFERARSDWYEKTELSEWSCFADAKATFNSIDTVGGKRYVFNIKGNSYRLIALIVFEPKIVYIRFIGTHTEYSKIKDCSKI
ncbi:hypothetical protein FACS189440_13730 [Bacteroidia bacterium]|nr:hypothetical protein FACS189440_13730 [Bacteroidia bacterium]